LKGEGGAKQMIRGLEVWENSKNDLYAFDSPWQIRKLQPRGLLSGIYPTTSSLPQFGL
jgi:hypothetical protein